MGNEGRICISYLEKKRTVMFQMDKAACKFLVEELTDFLNDSDDHFVDYDPETGYSCGILTKDSLGIIFSCTQK